MSNNIVISGSIVAEPESIGKAGNGIKVVLYDNEQKKDRDTGAYESTGNVTKLQIAVWGEENVEFVKENIRKGDIWQVEGSIVEVEYEKKDGTTGRQLELKFAKNWDLKYRKDNQDNGFGEDTPF